MIGGSTRGEQLRRADLLYLLILTLIAIVPRILRIGDQPLWSDEAFTLLIAKWPLRELLISPADPTPGLYYALHKFFVADGASVLVVRSISLVAGVLLIPLVGWFGTLLPGGGRALSRRRWRRCRPP